MFRGWVEVVGTKVRKYKGDQIAYCPWAGVDKWEFGDIKVDKTRTSKQKQRESQKRKIRCPGCHEMVIWTRRNRHPCAKRFVKGLENLENINDMKEVSEGNDNEEHPKPLDGHLGFPPSRRGEDVPDLYEE